MIKHIWAEIVNVVFYFMVIVLLFVGVRHYLIQPFQVSGHSMEQTLHNGEHLFLFPQGKIERFDIVVFPDPRGSGDSYVKRLIGLPGDTIEMKQDQLYLNGMAIPEPYLEPQKSQSGQQPFTQDFSLWDTLGITQIPEGYYFVMGDNRPESGDSRQFGLVPIASIQGKADLVYLPLDRIRRMPKYQLNANGSMTIESR